MLKDSILAFGVYVVRLAMNDLERQTPGEPRGCADGPSTRADLEISGARRVASQILAGHRVAINGVLDDPQAPRGEFKRSARSRPARFRSSNSSHFGGSGGVRAPHFQVISPP